MKFCMMVVPHKTNLDIYIFGMIECDVTSQWRHYARMPNTKMQDLRHNMGSWLISDL